VRSSGGSFIQFVPTLTADVKQATVGVTYGVVLIRFMFIMPTGVVGLVRRVAARLRGRLPPGSALGGRHPSGSGPGSGTATSDTGGPVGGDQVTEGLRVERADGVVTVTLDRPHRKNAVTGDGWADLLEVLRSVRPGEDRVLVLTGAGEDFCAGADLASTPGQTTHPLHRCGRSATPASRCTGCRCQPSPGLTASQSGPG